MTHEADTDGLGRRGALAALLGTAAVAAAGTKAEAAPASNVRNKSLSSPSGSPITTTIASPPKAGYAYRTLWYLDFLPLDPSASARTFGGSGGVYAASVLEASVEIPAGALLREVEWYVANTSGSNATYYCALWTPADGYITLFASVSVPSQATSSPSAHSTTTVSADWGPYPDGAKLIFYAPTSSTNLLNGVRVGFSGGGLEGAVRPASGLIYDSKVSGGIFANHETRTLTANGTGVGTSAAILLVTVTNATAAGQLRVFAAGQPTPDAASMDFPVTAASSTQLIVALNQSRQFSVRPTRSCHVRVDLVGWLR